LASRGVTKTIAGELVREHGEEKVRLQIDILDSLPKKKRDKIDDPAAYLVTAIRNGHAVPKGYVSPAERQAREQARQAKERQAAEERRRQKEEEARERAERQAADAYWKSLPPDEQSRLDAEALANADQATRDSYESMKRLGAGSDTFLIILRRDYIRQQLRNRQNMPVEA
jgi:hypothetical protein